MATEEIEWLDEELTNGYTELDAKVKELRSSAGKKLSKGARDDKFAEIDERFARVKDVLASYKVELRQVLKEVGKGTFKEFDEKGKVHNTNVNKLGADLEAAKKEAQARDASAENKAKKKKGYVEEFEGNKVIEEAKRVQLKTATAIEKATKLVNDMEIMGAEANVNLAAQSEQIKQTHSQVDEINAGLISADKKIRDIGRRLATDKLIVCMTLVIVCLVVVVIVMQFMGINPLKNLADCSLTSLQNAKQCLNGTESLLDELGLNTGGGFRPDPPKPTPAPKPDYSHCCVFINANLTTTTTPAPTTTTTPLPTTTPGPNQTTPAPAGSPPNLVKEDCGMLDANYVRSGEDVSIGFDEWKKNCISQGLCGGADQFECHAPPPETTTTPPPPTPPSDATSTPAPTSSTQPSETTTPPPPDPRRFLLWDQGSAATGESRGGKRIELEAWAKGGLAELGAEGRAAPADRRRLAVAKGAEAEAFARSAAGRQSALREGLAERGAGGGILFRTVDERRRPRA